MSEADRSKVCIEYALHAREVWATLDEFANNLAKGDEILRGELRMIAEFLR